MTDIDSKAAGFLDLPTEVRNQIYHNALVEDAPIDLEATQPFIIEPALLSATKQIRNEALPVFYGANTFAAIEYTDSRLFLRSFGAEKLNVMRKFRCVSSFDVISVVAQTVASPETLKWVYPFGELGFPTLVNVSVRLMAEQLGAVQSGLPANAPLLPLMKPNSQQYEIQTWVDFKEYKRYGLRERDGEIVLVRTELDGS